MLSRFNLIRIDTFYIFKLTSHSMLILKTQYILPIKAAHSTDLVWIKLVHIINEIW